MKNFKVELAVGIVCIILGLTLTLQFKSVKANYYEGISSSQKARELAEDLKKVREEKTKLMEELDALEYKINEIEESESKDSILIKNINQEIEKYKMISGLKSVEGSGIIVVVDDPPSDPELSIDTSIIMYHYELLLGLINKLNDAGAEAISINEQRYISKTEISLAGSNVNINSVATSPPFIIKAIGNPKTLEATLNIRFGIIDQMRSQYGLQVSVKKQDKVEINRYNDIIKFKYAKPILEKE